MRVRVVALAGLAAVFFVPPAGGQDTGPEVSLTLSEFEEDTVRTNHTLYAESFQLTLTMQNVVCTEDVTYPVTLEAVLAENGTRNGTANVTEVALGFTPASADFVVPKNAYILAAYGSTQELSFAVAPTLIPLGGLAVEGVVTATFNPGPNSGCASNPALSERIDEAAFSVVFQRSTEPEPPAPPEKKLPGPGTMGVLGVVALSFLIGRRRVA